MPLAPRITRHLTRTKLVTVAAALALTAGGVAVAQQSAPTRDRAHDGHRSAHRSPDGGTTTSTTPTSPESTDRTAKNGRKRGGDRPDKPSRGGHRGDTTTDGVGSSTGPDAGLPDVPELPLPTDPTPSPSPTSPPSDPSPTATGFPDASTTGARGTLTRHDGAMTVSRDGAVIKDLDIRGELRITADNVTVKNVRVQTNSFWVVLVQGRGVTLEDSTFIGGDDSQASLAGVFVGRRLNLSGAGDGIKMMNGGELYDSYIHDLATFDGAHNDGIEAGGPVKIVHNTVLNQNSQTSAIMLSEYGSDPDTNVLVKDNLIGGAGYTLYGGAPDSASGHVVTGNRFTTRFFADSGYYGPVAYWKSAGNTFTDNRWFDGPRKGELVSPRSGG